MTKLQDGELLDLLPAQLKHDTDMICLSYAIKCETERLLKYARGTMANVFIDEVPEKVLDLLAVELRVAYYDQNLDIKVRRELVKNALNWHKKAGTPAAVEELVKIVFGSGEVSEWYEYGALPYWFKIATDAPLQEEAFAFFARMLRYVKNVRSHIGELEIDRVLPQLDIHAGTRTEFSTGILALRGDENLEHIYAKHVQHRAGGRTEQSDVIMALRGTEDLSYVYMHTVRHGAGVTMRMETNATYIFRGDENFTKEEN